MTLHTLTLPYRFIARNERSLVLFLGLGIILSIGMYMYGVIDTTIAVTERRDLESEIRLANTRISETEIAYFNAISEITPEYAATLGFVEAKTNVAFAYAGTGSNVAFAQY